ncbi:MAG: ribonuclease P protein component 4 [Euryarchaeota archaeon]|nr:ribonuclease P protein component 4 [Euryarchaeota archaeon]
MARRRISAREARNIARTRMDRLMDLAIEEVREGRIDRSRRYVSLARKIGMRTNTPMTKDRIYCRKCMVALLPGWNCKVRLRSNRVVIHCLTCGAIQRAPYLREKKGESDE